MLSFCARTKIADEEFHVQLESLKNVQFGMGRDELPVWWYDFHNLIFFLYKDKIVLLLLMGGRRQIKPWDPRILRNDKVQKVVEKFGSLQRRKWDPGIMLSYFNWVGNFAKGSGIKNGYDQSGAAKTWWKNLQHYVVLLLEDKQIWEGRTVMFPQIDH